MYDLITLPYIRLTKIIIIIWFLKTKELTHKPFQMRVASVFVWMRCQWKSTFWSFMLSNAFCTPIQMILKTFIENGCPIDDRVTFVRSIIAFLMDEKWTNALWSISNPLCNADTFMRIHVRWEFSQSLPEGGRRYIVNNQLQPLYFFELRHRTKHI